MEPMLRGTCDGVPSVSRRNSNAGGTRGAGGDGHAGLCSGALCTRKRPLLVVGALAAKLYVTHRRRNGWPLLTCWSS
jgi:hypothetical protein